MNSDLLDLLIIFGTLSLLAVGGGTATLPAMQQAVISKGWMSAQDFAQLYNLGQLSCGPNLLMIVELGRRVAGPAGATVAGLAFFGPPCLVTLLASRMWGRCGSSPWRRAVQQGLAPLTVGLMLASAQMLARASMIDRFTLVIGMLATFILYFSRRVNPAMLVLGSGLLGWFAY